MSLGEILSDAVTYPFTDIVKFLIVGVLALLAGLSNSFPSDSLLISALFAIISFVFGLILSGYSIQVIKKGIQHSNEIPDVDPVANLIDGIKVVIIAIVYFIIPFIVAFVLGAFSSLVGLVSNHTITGIGLGTIIAFIVFLLFAIFEIVAEARFANSGNLGDALNIGEVIADTKRIGILKIILFLIITVIICIVAAIIISLLAFIPFVGVIIAVILLGGFMALFYNKALGLLYASA